MSFNRKKGVDSMSTFEERVAEAAKEVVGNWTGFKDFVWFEKPENADVYCLVYTTNRDDGLLGQSNAAAIAKEMQPFIDSGDVFEEHHSHWACGFVDGYAIRVHRDGEVTEAFSTWIMLKERLDEHPVLDENDYSTREYDATIENIEQAGRRLVGDDAPEDWAARLFDWFEANDQHAVENCDDRGGYPSEASMVRGLEVLKEKENKG